jgi:hypothetical protein
MRKSLLIKAWLPWLALAVALAIAVANLALVREAEAA